MRGRSRGPATAAVAVVAIGLVVLAARRIGSDGLGLPAHERLLASTHGTWRAIFEPGSGQMPLLTWVAALVVLGLVGLPYAFVACRGLPDRGAALARPLGLLLVGWATWWLCSLRLLPFGRTAIGIALLGVAAGALALVLPRRHELGAWVQAHRRVLVVQEALFWSVFAAATMVRFLNPDLWHPTLGGEKPMDLAYLTAVVKSTHFPPFDPWFAGGTMNYYYFGFVLVAVLIKATSIVPVVAYNLAVPTFAAFLSAAAFSTVLGLVGASSRRRQASLWIATLGALFVAVLGNLGELRVIRNAIDGNVPLEWWYWNASRVIRHPLDEPGPISEFPSFTYLFADLHAHAMALPFGAVALALAVAVVRGRHEPLCSTATVLRGSLLALVLGSLWSMNSWDLPTYLLVSAAAIALAWTDGLRRLSAKRIGAAAGSLTLCVLAAYVFFLPFQRHYVSVFEGVERWRGGRTAIGDYLTVHGLFLFAISSALLVELATNRYSGSVVRSVRLRLRRWDDIRRHRQLMALLVRPRAAHTLAMASVAGVLIASVAAGVLGHGVLALAFPVSLLCLELLLDHRVGEDQEAPLRRLIMFLILLGLVLSVAVEYVVVRNIDVGRTNSVFKLYLQVWVLWAVGAAACVAIVYEQLPAVPRVIRLCWRSVFVLLLAIAATYPVLATWAKIRDRFDPAAPATLDGAAFMRTATFEAKGVRFPLRYDADAFRWIQEHVDGSPVIGEATTDPVLYGWGNRYAMFTGNPAIVGWDYHQRQQRPSQTAEIRQRTSDVQEVYRTRDPAHAHRLLRSYGAGYVVVGPLELAYFPPNTNIWRRGQGQYWNLVYANAGVRVYRVLP